MEEKVYNIKETCKEVIDNILSITDYDELDLTYFLNIKIEGKYYNLLTKKILIYIIYIIVMLNQLYLINTSDLLIRIIVSIICTILGLKLLDYADHLDAISRKKFKFTIGFYKRERKELLNYQAQIHILFNNQYLLKIIKSEKASTYKEKIMQMNEKIETYANAIRPITYKIKQYGLIGISVSLILSFFTNFLIQYFLNPEIIVPLLLLGIVLPAINIFLFGIGYFFLKKRKNKILYNLRPWLQLTKALLSRKIKDLVFLLHSIEFSNLEETANDLLKEIKAKLKEETITVVKKIEDMKSRLIKLKEKEQQVKRDKEFNDLKSIKLEKIRLKKEIKNFKEEKKNLKEKLKT